MNLNFGVVIGKIDLVGDWIDLKNWIWNDDRSRYSHSFTVN